MKLAGLAAFVATLTLAAPALATPGRVAVGVAEGASLEEVAALVEVATGQPVDRGLGALDALVVRVADRDAAVTALAELPGVDYVEPIRRSRSLAFTPSDPLILFQWYLTAIHALDYWAERPQLPAVRVAVIDSGIDGSHPEFAGRIAASRSFVRGRATEDTLGHGTLVAGEIAAAMDNGLGIAGAGFPVELIVAKVVDPNGRISTAAEAEAIRWAADQGARVINLSLGGRRDPKTPANDTYSELEHAAIEYAYRKGAVIVAAAGNCDLVCPYPYASYPAALPHVLGVSALAQDGTTPSFSNRDPVYNDLAAPGAGIVSTFPFDLTDPACAQPGYSMCATNHLRSGQGTSFAAPLVAAAAALLLAERPTLHASQVLALLEANAEDVGPAGRDAATGRGLVNVQRALGALAAPLPPADRYETNDDAGSRARTLYGAKHTISATIDHYDDPSDVYRTYLRAGQGVTLKLAGPPGKKTTIAIWRPGTTRVTEITALAVRAGSVVAYARGASASLAYRIRKSGWYYVEVKAPARSGGAYRLTVRKIP
ncbi:MAG: S8 family serine peptidase [Thermoleophilia bacterium]|nr:S8 family serine peptidase [Thermoleophilia bacterium]